MNSGGPINTVKDLGTAITNEGERKKSQDKHSGFFITINTNYRPKAEGDAEEVAERLRKVVGAMLDNAGLERVVEFMVPGHTFSGSTILNVDGEFIIERGRHPKGGRIHSHASLHIKHRSKIRLNIPAMKEFLMEGFSDYPAVKSVYVNIKAIGSDRLIKDYLRKEIDSRQE